MGRAGSGVQSQEDRWRDLASLSHAHRAGAQLKEERLRVLFVSPLFPQTPSGTVVGAYRRMHMWLDAIQSLDVDLDILLFPPAGAAHTATSWLQDEWKLKANVQLCRREAEQPSRGVLSQYLDAYVRPALRFSCQPAFRPYLGKPQRDALARCLARAPDVVFFHRLHAAGAALAAPLNGARILLDLDDVEHRRLAREVRQPPRWRFKPLLYLQVPALWWGERRAIRRADRAFVCSEIDRRYLHRAMGVKNVEVVPNAVPCVAEAPPSGEPNVLFIGTYNYSPNAVAADHLIRDVWPLVARACPDARLLIAGPNSDAIGSKAHAPPGVEFLGFVPDLRALYGRARVLCCPIRSGSGTRIKILEAASHGVPVVSTLLGAEGIDLEPEKEIVLRDSAAELAAACVDLLRDGPRAERIGAAGRERTRALYSREVVVRRMALILSECS